MYEGVLFSLSFFIPERTKKASEEGKREDDGRGEVREEEGEMMRCGENEGGRGREDREG